MNRDTIYSMYSGPQLGRGLPVYAGSQRQVGGGIFGALARFALPVLKTVGKRALSVAKKTVRDVAMGKSGLKDALITNAKQEVVKAISPKKQSSPQQAQPPTIPQKRQPVKRKRQQPSKQNTSINKRKKRDIFQDR